MHFYRIFDMLDIMRDIAESKLNTERFNFERVLIALALSMVVFFIYAKTLTGDFNFDVRPNIKENSK